MMMTCDRMSQCAVDSILKCEVPQYRSTAFDMFWLPVFDVLEDNPTWTIGLSACKPHNTDTELGRPCIIQCMWDPGLKQVKDEEASSVTACVCG